MTRPDLQQAVAETLRRPLFSQRLRMATCAVCGPGMGILARDVPVLGDPARRAVVPVLCRACGGNSAAWKETATS